MSTSTALWRRALRRVERRATVIRAARPLLGEAVTLTHEYALLRQAVRTANRLAVAAGILP